MQESTNFKRMFTAFMCPLDLGVRVFPLLDLILINIYGILKPLFWCELLDTVKLIYFCMEQTKTLLCNGCGVMFVPTAS